MDAQRHYERRIRAALEPDTVTGWQDISTESKAVEALQSEFDALLVAALSRVNGNKDLPSLGEFIKANWPTDYEVLMDALPPAPEKEG